MQANLVLVLVLMTGGVVVSLDAAAWPELGSGVQDYIQGLGHNDFESVVDVTFAVMKTPNQFMHPEMQLLSSKLHGVAMDLEARYVANKASYNNFWKFIKDTLSYLYQWLSATFKWLFDKFPEAMDLTRFLPFAKTAFAWNEIWKTFVVIRETTKYTDLTIIKINMIEKDLNSTLHKMSKSFEAYEKGEHLPYSMELILEELHTIEGELAHCMQELKQKRAIIQERFDMHYRNMIDNILTTVSDIFRVGSIGKWLTGVGYVIPALTVAETVGHGYTMKRCSDVFEVIDIMIRNIDVLLHKVEEELEPFFQMWPAMP